MTATHLFFYQCSLCRTTLSSPARGRFNCPVCYQYMRTLFSQPITTDEERARAAAGVVFMTAAQPIAQPWLCVRCGETFTTFPEIRPDGKCCAACVAAEAAPDEPHEDRTASRNQVIQDDEARMEAAYRQLETNHQETR